MRIRREVKLSVTAIAALIILVWGINFLKAKALFDRNNIYYGVYEQVDGLRVSCSVIYRGYHVGQVNSITFTGERFDKVLVEFSVGKDLEIPANTIAVIQSADLMGSKAINLIPGDSPMYAQNGDTLQSRLSLGLMEQLNEQLEPLKRKAENIMGSLDTLLVSLQGMFNEEEHGNIRGSLKSVGRTLDNVEQTSETLNHLLSRESMRISDILEDVNSITANLEGHNSDIGRTLGNISAISDSLKAASISSSVRSLNRVLLQVDSIVVKINRGQGTLGGVVNDDEFYYNLVGVSNNLNKLLIEFRQNPKRFVNLSVFDFASGKSENNPYGIVIAESDRPVALNSDLYLKHPDIREIRKNGRYLYLISTHKNLKQAQKELDVVKKSVQMSYIVKIDQSSF